MADKYTIEEILSFIDGTMDSVKADDFAKKLTADPALAKEVDEQKKLSRLVQIAALKSKLNDVHEAFVSEEPTIIEKKQGLSITWRVLSLAAILTGVILFLIFYKSGNNLNDKIFAVYFKDDSGTPSLMGSTASAFDEGMVYYKSENYTQAHSKFSALIDVGKNSDTIKYYDALCQVHLKNDDKALQLLQSIPPNSQTEYGTKAQWYSALIYVKQDNLNKAKELLAALQKSNYTYYSLRAAKVLHDLKTGSVK